MSTDERELLALAIAEQNRTLAVMLQQNKLLVECVKTLARRIEDIEERLGEVQSRSPGEW